MTRGRKAWLAAGLLTFLLALLVMFPARVAYRLVAPPGVVISGIDGTLWRGSANALNASGVYLTDVTWELRPLALLGGRLACRLQARPARGFIEADIAVGIGGAVSIDNATGSVPLGILAAPLRVPGLDGAASIELESLVIRDGLPVAAEGTIAVDRLVVPLVDSGSIGGYRADLATQADAVVAAIEDTDGLFDISGSLTIGSDRSYRFLGQIAAKPETPDKLRRQMLMLGSADAQGRREVRLEGAL